MDHHADTHGTGTGTGIFGDDECLTRAIIHISISLVAVVRAVLLYAFLKKIKK
jgi:hypothetical protein